MLCIVSYSSCNLIVRTIQIRMNVHTKEMFLTVHACNCVVLHVPVCTYVRMSYTVQPKKKDWRQQHEQFVASIRAAREVTRSIAKGGPLPAYTPSAPNPDYVQCPYCERRFQDDTAQRHIPFCKEKSQRLNSKANKSAGTEMLSKRIQVSCRRGLVGGLSVVLHTYVYEV